MAVTRTKEILSQPVFLNDPLYLRKINDEAVQIHYNSDNKLTNVGEMEYTYDDKSGYLTERKMKNITEKFTYNRYGEIVTYTVTNGPAILFQSDFVRDEITGNIKEKIESIKKADYYEHISYIYTNYSFYRDVNICTSTYSACFP